MRLLRFAVLNLVGALLVATGAQASDKGIFYEFPSYRGAKLLCQEHVMAAGAEIHWRTFAVADEVAAVVAFYEKALGTKAERDDKGGFRLRATPAASSVLTVYAPARADTYPHCGEKPAAGDRAVILVSVRYQR